MQTNPVCLGGGGAPAWALTNTTTALNPLGPLPPHRPGPLHRDQPFWLARVALTVQEMAPLYRRHACTAPHDGKVDMR